MGRLVAQVRMLTRAYVRKGGKTNRRQQVARMLAFARFCESEGVTEINRLGARQVILYWMQNRHLAPSTQYNHYRALCILWELAEKVKGPPVPRPGS